jgi:hypothetical protein
VQFVAGAELLNESGKGLNERGKGLNERLIVVEVHGSLRCLPFCILF